MSVGWFSFAMALVGFIFTDVTLTTDANYKSMNNKKINDKQREYIMNLFTDVTLTADTIVINVIFT